MGDIHWGIGPLSLDPKVQYTHGILISFLLLFYIFWGGPRPRERWCLAGPVEDVWARSRRTVSYCWQVGWPPSWGRSWTYSFLAWAMSLQWALRHCWFLPSHLLHWCR